MSDLSKRHSGNTREQRPRLLDELRNALRARRYSPRTETVYLRWVVRYIRFHQRRHPREMGEVEVAAFLTSLAVDSNVSASTQNQALSAILFLYRRVLRIQLPWLDEVVRAKKPLQLPVVLGRGEIQRVIDELKDPAKLIAELLYGAGLRLDECFGFSAAPRRTLQSSLLHGSRL